MKRKTQLIKCKQQRRKSDRDSLNWHINNQLKQRPPENDWKHPKNLNRVHYEKDSEEGN